MSGGSLDYIYLRIQTAAEQICKESNGHEWEQNLKRFAGAVQIFAEVIRAVELDLSDDQPLSESDRIAMHHFILAAEFCRVPREQRGPR